MTTMTQQARADAGPVSRFAKWAPLAIVLCGTFIFVLDFFVVNVALPSIARDLRASAAAIEWLVSGYALTTAALLVTGGRLGDHYGRRRLFSIGLAVFVLASALCAVAPDPSVLVAARVLQGAGAGVMAPNILAILGMTYTGPDRVRAISVYGMVMGLAAVSGQLVGGLLIDANVAGLGWRAIFWINVPIGLAALALAVRVLRDRGERVRRRLDPLGMITLGLGQFGVLWAMT
ncbi:MAG: MFS transporter, partial [Trebonia sp.]